MADSAVAVTQGSGTNIDTRTEATNGQHRQVIVIGDPSTNAGVAPVDATNGVAVDVKAIAAGTNAIGKLAANSGVDIGDVTLTAGSDIVGKVGIDQTTSGTTNAVVNIPITSGGLSIAKLISAATTNATNVKASAGQLYGWSILNTNSTIRYVKLHNTAGTPTAGASVVYTIGIPASGGSNIHIDQGLPFSTGIAFTTVTGAAESDTAAVGANDLIINLHYK